MASILSTKDELKLAEDQRNKMNKKLKKLEKKLKRSDNDESKLEKLAEE